jgi:hypothetical protein
MNSGVFMESQKIKPCTRRYLCGFYGFELKGDSMIDTGENQCGFAAILNLPQSSYCLKEMMRDKINWLKCPLNTEENEIKSSRRLEDIRFFPKEHIPPKGRWKGWPLKIWMRHVMDGELVEE